MPGKGTHHAVVEFPRYVLGLFVTAFVLGILADLLSRQHGLMYLSSDEGGGNP